MADAEVRDDLAEFLRVRKKNLALSYRDLAARAIDPVTGQAVLGYQWLDRLAHNQLSRAPTASQLRALAAALETEPQVIKALAARQWLDYEPQQTLPGTAAPESLSQSQRDALRRIVAEFVNAIGRGGNGGDGREGGGPAHA